jgi:Flp pilus assembly CpaF family ATPase
LVASAKGVELIRNYLKILDEFEENLSRLPSRYKELKNRLYSDPIQAYYRIEKIRKSNKTLSDLYQLLSKTDLIKEAKLLSSDLETTNQGALYELLLQIRKTPKQQVEIRSNPWSGKTLTKYRIGPFTIKLTENPLRPFERFYLVSVELQERLSTQIAHLLSTRQIQKSNEVELLSLNEVLQQTTQQFRNVLSSSFKELDEEERENLALFSTTQLLDLTRTMPLLLDNEVQEFYLDKPGKAYYLDHAEFGRCKSNLIPSRSELSRISTRLRLESRRPLDDKTPSIKTELDTEYFHVRASIDIPPLAHEGIHLNIRKLRLRCLTLPELIYRGTLTIEAAAFLMLSLSLRLNMTISGEPSSGKTTLANAVNLLTPPNWRRIAIEDALESISLKSGVGHNVTFKVDPFDSIEEKRHTKSNEIIRLLHRSPDWVFLGEVQTAEHSSAMFHALSAGIRGIQTCHANSNRDLLLRWKIHHNIPEVCFHSLGLLIHMVRNLFHNRIERRISQISEIDTQTSTPSLRTLFEWDKTENKLRKVIPSVITPLISQACAYQQLTEEDLQERYDCYARLLKHLVDNQIFNPNEVSKAFEDSHNQILPKEMKEKPAAVKSVNSGGGQRRLPQICGSNQ